MEDLFPFSFLFSPSIQIRDSRSVNGVMTKELLSLITLTHIPSVLKYSFSHVPTFPSLLNNGHTSFLSDCVIPPIQITMELLKT